MYSYRNKILNEYLDRWLVCQAFLLNFCLYVIGSWAKIFQLSWAKNVSLCGYVVSSYDSRVHVLWNLWNAIDWSYCGSPLQFPAFLPRAFFSEASHVVACAWPQFCKELRQTKAEESSRSSCSFLRKFLPGHFIVVIHQWACVQCSWHHQALDSWQVCRNLCEDTVSENSWIKRWSDDFCLFNQILNWSKTKPDYISVVLSFVPHFVRNRKKR